MQVRVWIPRSKQHLLIYFLLLSYIIGKLSHIPSRHCISEPYCLVWIIKLKQTSWSARYANILKCCFYRLNLNLSKGKILYYPNDVLTMIFLFFIDTGICIFNKLVVFGAKLKTIVITLLVHDPKTGIVRWTVDFCLIEIFIPISSFFTSESANLSIFDYHQKQNVISSNESNCFTVTVYVNFLQRYLFLYKFPSFYQSHNCLHTNQLIQSILNQDRGYIQETIPHFRMKWNLWQL